MFLIWLTSKRDKGKTETGEGQKMGERKKIKNKNFNIKRLVSWDKAYCQFWLLRWQPSINFYHHLLVMVKYIPKPPTPSCTVLGGGGG
jgi:hypothetical protein